MTRRRFCTDDYGGVPEEITTGRVGPFLGEPLDNFQRMPTANIPFYSPRSLYISAIGDIPFICIRPSGFNRTSILFRIELKASLS